MRIIDPVTKRESPSGKPGDIAITGGFMVGYWGQPEKTREVIRDGWLFTGDVGLMDADGYVYVRGRSSERLLVAGEAWYPRDVEEALLEHPDVIAAAMIGFPDAKLGERPTTYVVLKDGSKVDDTALIVHAQKRVSVSLSHLSIRRVKSLPMTPTGKISKADLKAQELKALEAS